ncbi:MAG: hypothetical protein HYY30_10080 [Chloroflexi bacterium]|nr:hypothetical protein [Chloroflexota bacterium]
MRLLIVIADGMADWRYHELGGRSPVESAHTPGIDEIVRRGQVGLAQTMYDGLPLGTLVGILGVLGYRPSDHFPLERSIFEARALGVPLMPSDIVFRCNIVQVSDDDCLVDFTAGQIDDAAARRYLGALQLPAGLELIHDLSYRGVLIHRDCRLDERELLLHEPHEYVGSRIEEILPRYQGRVCESLVDVILRSRRDGLMLWPWGASRMNELPSVPYRLVAVSALSFLCGLVDSIGGKGIIPPGATSYRGSDLSAKLAAAKAHLLETDVCLIHCNAPDEEAHVRNLRGKVQAIEEIDRLVVAPFLRYLDRLDEPWRLWFLPDHYTVCSTGKHMPGLVPYALCGQGIVPDHRLRAYSEAAIAAASSSKTARESHQFVRCLLRG